MNDTLTDKQALAIDQILATQLQVQRDQLLPDSKIIEDLGADSLDIMEICLAVEEKFDIALPDERAARVVTVEDLYQAVAEILRA
jgi:acyl carrier protein